MKTRCLNIDWLEVHCLEPSGLQARDAEFFRLNGWDVREREYGTRVYEQMFTLLQPGTLEPLIEIRRLPVGNKSAVRRYVIDPQSCHIRLHNRTCYFASPASLLFDFIVRYQYSFMRISRIDICLDFEKFDSGDEPQKFIERYLQGRYSKINQANIAAHGKDQWDGRHWNSLKWGSPSSQVSTKLYNKTLEISEGKDKPYVRQAWAACGLVHDFIKLTKFKSIKDEKGSFQTIEYKPVIWRLEFSIQSAVKRWFVIEDYKSSKKKIRSEHNTLDCYFTPEQIMNVFASLADHYFHFKKKIKTANGDEQRKDRCPDKMLFNFQEQNQYFRVERITTAKTDTLIDEALKKKLEEYMIRFPSLPIVKACETIINDITKNEITSSAERPWDVNELTLLRMLVARHIKQPDSPVSKDLQEIKTMLEIQDDFFGEVDKKGNHHKKKAVQ